MSSNRQLSLENGPKIPSTKTSGTLFFLSKHRMAMPKKTSSIPKSITADINRLKSRLASIEKSSASMMKEFKATMKSHSDMMKKQEQMISQLGKKSAKREKRKPSAYNLFLKDKMSQGITMVDAVKAWKAKEGGMGSSTSSQTQEWQKPSQEH